MNQLTNNFVLIKTYEQTMKQYEQELENFKLRTQQFEEEQAILIQKNSDLGQQLYVMKTRISKGGDPSALTSTDEEKIDRIEKDQMVSLLKKNLDNLMEKNHFLRNKSESSEKLLSEMDLQFTEMKAQNDQLSHQLNRVRKDHDEMKYIKESLQTQVFKVQESYKGSNEDMKTLKIQKDRYEGQAKVLGEQLEVIQQSYDELSTKKNGETDLLSKEINQLSLRDRESRQKLQWSENEVNELKDQIRSVTNELDTRTQENDHLISLLEDQEQKMA